MAIRTILQGQQLRPAEALFEVMARASGTLGFQALLGARPCRERDLVAAMVTARILAPHTKLATTR